MFQQQVTLPKPLTESQKKIVDALKSTDFKNIGKVSEVNENGKVVISGDKALELLKEKLKHADSSKPNDLRASLDDLEKGVQSNQPSSREDRLLSLVGSIQDFQKKQIDQMESSTREHPKKAEVEALLSGVTALTDKKSEFNKVLTESKLSQSQKEAITRSAVQDIYLKANELIDSK